LADFTLSICQFLFFVRSAQSPLRQVYLAGLPVCVAGLVLVGAYSGGIYAIQTTTVAKAMLLFAAAPFLAAILGWIFLNEVVKRSTGIAIFVASIGIAIMVVGQTEGGALIGTLAGLGLALGFAFFNVALRWEKSVNMMPSILLSALFAIIITVCVCWLTDLSFVLRPNDAGISVAIGIFQVGAGLILYTLGSKTVLAAELALLSLAEVLLGSFLGLVGFKWKHCCKYNHWWGCFAMRLDGQWVTDGETKRPLPS
jgi:drug/metabolite transporter, DME family